MSASNGKIAVIDYGAGNLFNVLRAIEHLQGEAYIATTPDDIKDAHKVILPGVGAFESGINNLNESGLSKAIKDHADSGKHLLGICLGMQLLFTESEENGNHKGLNIIPGQVKRFDEDPEKIVGYKIPQIGWNSLEPGMDWNETLFDGLNDGCFVYFLHSYYCEPTDSKVVLSTSRYGVNHFCSAVKKQSVYACQFHPERSAEIGLKILKNFIAIK